MNSRSTTKWPARSIMSRSRRRNHHPLKGGDVNPPPPVLSAIKTPSRTYQGRKKSSFSLCLQHVSWLFVMFHDFNQNWLGNLRRRPTQRQLKTFKNMLFNLFVFIVDDFEQNWLGNLRRRPTQRRFKKFKTTHVIALEGGVTSVIALSWAQCNRWHPPLSAFIKGGWYLCTQSL